MWANGLLCLCFRWRSRIYLTYFVPALPESAAILVNALLIAGITISNVAGARASARLNDLPKVVLLQLQRGFDFRSGSPDAATQNKEHEARGHDSKPNQDQQRWRLKCEQHAAERSQSRQYAQFG